LERFPVRKVTGYRGNFWEHWTNREVRLHSGLPQSNIMGLKEDLNDVRKQLKTNASQLDIDHLRKIEGWIKACGILGIGTAWIFPNPVSILLLSQYKFGSWTMLAHHILHKGYDTIPGVPHRYTSKGFARGFRRYLDWLDWIWPTAWVHEHNHLHHAHLGETADPDLVERNIDWLRKKTWHPYLKMGLVVVMALTWKFVYYAGNTLRTWLERRYPEKNIPSYGSLAFWNPFSFAGSHLWLHCLLPYVLVNFIALPALFLFISTKAAIFVLINLLLAEMITNLHSFAVIVTNHTGDDIYRYDTSINSKEEFYFRQIAGSVNYPTGSDFNDFMHGFLNYQIEHHLWPDLTMLQYKKAQPMVQAIAEQYGIPYTQQSVPKRVMKTVQIMCGLKDMPVYQQAPLSNAAVQTT